MQKLLPVLKAIADNHGVAIVNVATQYILNQKSVGAVMVGIRNSKHVASNIQTLEFDLTDEEMKKIRDSMYSRIFSSITFPVRYFLTDSV